MWIRMLIIGGFGFIGMLLLWRESHWRAQSNELLKQRQNFQAQASQWKQKSTKTTRTLQDCRASLDNLRAELKEKSARTGNQQTQIDVLKKRWKSSRKEKDELKANLADQTDEIRSLRTRLLDTPLSKTPGIEDKLAHCREKMRTLSTELDEAAEQLSHLPTLSICRGISSDGRLIALAPENQPARQPQNQSFTLARRKEVVARGHFYEAREDLWIFRIDHWHIPFSALVIGEKLFILAYKDDGKDI